MAKKEATTAAQFELLVTEMEKHPDVARGMPKFGSSKEKVDSIWESIAKRLNAIGPPIRTTVKWRKVWTDYRGRLKKKISNNTSSIRQTGGGPSEYSELTPLEVAVDNIVSTSVAAKPSGNVFGLKVANTVNETSNTKQVSSPAVAALSDFLSSEASQVPQTSSSPVENALTVEENSLELTPIKLNISSRMQTSGLKKRRQIAKDEERRKLIKLSEKQTEEISRQTIALEKLTAAVEAQTRLLQEIFK